MTLADGEKPQLSTLIGVFTLIMMAVFSAEVAVMQLYADLFTRIGIFQRALLDSSTLVLIIALPLWFFVFSPSFREKIKQDGGYASVAFSLYVKVLAGLYLIQLFVMLVLPGLMSYLPQEYENLVDGALTVLIFAPLFWWLLYRLELHYRLEPLADFLNAPLTLYILLLFMIFLADLLQEILFPQLSLEMTGIQFQLFDALVTIALIAPLLLILVVRPLKRMAQSENARTHAIYDQVADAIIKIDKFAIVESLNLAAQKVFGLTPQDILGKSASQLLDRGKIDLIRVLQDLSNDQEPEVLKFYDLSSVRFDNGQRLVLDLTVSKVKLEGPDEFLLLLHDISDHKATEEALLATDAIFREIFNQTEDAILFFEPLSGEILDVNVTSEKLYGFSKRELQNSGINAFCDAESKLQFKSLLRDIEHHGNAQSSNMINRRADGQQIIVSVRGKMMTLQGAQVVFCTVRDISERVRLENASREIQAKLIHANKMTSLGLLVSGVAHEINNPNNFVQANAQILAKVWKDAQIILGEYYKEHGDFVIGGMDYSELEKHTPEIFHGITDGSRRINAIISELKHFVRQDPSQPHDEVDINSVVTSAISMLHYELVKHTSNFQLDLGEDLPLIRGSSQQLGQVIINLLMNACQSLPDTSCAVWLATDYEPDKQLVRISVRDQGAGLPDALRDRILEPFFTTKIESGGTGLGLSISMAIIKDHGGQLDYYSQLGTGSTFTVTIPAVRSAR